MTQLEIDEAVAAATGETVMEVRRRGFGIADPVEVQFDPEPSVRRPLVLDWDTMGPVPWPRA